jgi:rod shape-determining protein MreC
MGDIFKNKIFIILLIVVCVCTIATMVLSISGRGNIISSAANFVISPFQNFAGLIGESVTGFADYFVKFNELKEENAELKKRVAELENSIEDAKITEEENERFRAVLELKKAHPDYKFQDAAVIGQSTGNYISYFTVNKGDIHGVKKDMPVIADNAVVGYVSEVDVASSKVTPFIRTSNSVGAFIKRSRDTCLAQGDFELEKEGICRISTLSDEVDIQSGDEIYTSGYGGIYPEGLYIGRVSEVFPDPLTHTPAAYIEPAVNFSKLQDVMIILEFDWVFY